MQKPRTYERFEAGLHGLTGQLSRLLNHRYGLWVLGVISFIESLLLLPIITDPFLVAYVVTHKTRTLTAVLVTVVTSVLGGVLSYITAAFFIDLVLNHLSPDSVAQFHNLVTQFKNSTFMLAFIGAVTPIPFTLTALVAGTIKGSLLIFILGSLVGRSIRYGLVGYLTYVFGEKAITLGKRYLGQITILTFVLVIIYFWSTM